MSGSIGNESGFPFHSNKRDSCPWLTSFDSQFSRLPSLQNNSLLDILDAPCSADEFITSIASRKRIHVDASEPIPMLSSEIKLMRTLLRDELGRVSYISISAEDESRYGKLPTNKRKKGLDLSRQKCDAVDVQLNVPQVRVTDSSRDSITPALPYRNPDVALTCPPRIRIATSSTRRRANRLTLQDLSKKAVECGCGHRFLSSNMCDAIVFSERLDRHAFASVGSFVNGQRILTYLLRFHPPTGSAETIDSCCVALTTFCLQGTEVQSHSQDRVVRGGATGSQSAECTGFLKKNNGRGGFVVYCSEDQTVSLLAHGESSSCKHALVVLDILWPKGSLNGSIVGRTTRDILCQPLACVDSPFLGSRTEVLLMGNHFTWRHPRSITFIIMVRSDKLNVPIMAFGILSNRDGLSMRFECQRCPGKSGRRGICEHEHAAEQKVADAGLCREFSASLRKDLAIAEDRSSSLDNVPPTPQASQEYELPGKAYVENHAVNDDHQNCNPYVSQIRRSPFPCASDLLCAAARHEREQGNQLQPTLIDSECSCDCGYTSFDTRHENLFELRSMTLLRSEKKPLLVTVRDWECPKCRKAVRYDGFDEGLFSSSRTYLWCRSRLDALVASQCRFSTTGRSASGLRTDATRASLFELNPKEKRDRLQNEAGRRQETEAVAMYISKLGDASGSPGSLSAIFRCQNGCEPSRSSGVIRLCIDGTATGIFAKLPTFTRKAVFLSPLTTEASRKQYLLGTEHEREGVRFLCCKSLRKGNKPQDERPESLNSIWISLHDLCAEGKSSSPAVKKRRRESVAKLFEIGCGSRGDVRWEFLTDLLVGDSCFDWSSVNAMKNLFLEDWDTEDEAFICSLSRKSVALFLGTVFAYLPSPDQVTTDDEKVGDCHVMGASPRLPTDALRRAAYSLAVAFASDSPFALLESDRARTDLLKVSDFLWRSGSMNESRNAEEFRAEAKVLSSECSIGVVRIFLLAVMDNLFGHQSSDNLSERSELPNHENDVFPDGQGARDVAAASSLLFRSALITCLNFEAVYARDATDSSRKYEEEFGKSCSPVSDQLDDAFLEGARSGHFYPGLKAVRSEISFHRDKSVCEKKYPVSHNLSPGIVVVTCGCSNHMLRGFSIMTSAESLSFIWSIVLMYFNNAMLIFYDNSCNLLASILTRCRWSLENRRLLVDRFHVQGHTCGAGFDASGCDAADGFHSSSAESVNALIGAVRASIRYIRPSNYVTFVGLRCMFINLGSKWRQKTGRSDSDNADLAAFGNVLMPCKCKRCSSSRENSAAFRAFEESTFLGQLNFEINGIPRRAATSNETATEVRLMAARVPRTWFNPTTKRMIPAPCVTRE